MGKLIQKNMVYASKANPMIAVALLALAMLTAMLFTGLLLGAGQWILAAFLFGIVGFVALSIFALRGIDDHLGILILGGWIGMVLSPGLNYLAKVPVGYIFEVIIFGFAVAALRSWWMVARSDKAVRVLILLLALHMIVMLLSTIFGRSRPFAAFWQFQYSLKWPLMFGLGMMIVWSSRPSGKLNAIVAWSWLVIVPVILLEILKPDLHKAMFGPFLDSTVNPFIGEGVRHRGPFARPGSLALICGFLAVVAVIQFLLSRAYRWLPLAMIYTACVLISGQRQELAGLILTLLLIGGIHFRRQLPLLVIAALAVAWCVVAGLIILEYVPMRSTLGYWGFFDDPYPLSARAVLTYKGLQVAELYFPLGSGLGTYGGPGAQKYDQTLYLDLGFGNLWWFRMGQFLVDTYWPCIFAESGFFGAMFLAAFFFVAWVVLFIRACSLVGTQEYGITLMALAALSLLLANTPSSATLTDPRGVFVLWMVVGAAFRAYAMRAVPARDAKRTPVALPTDPISEKPTALT